MINNNDLAGSDPMIHDKPTQIDKDTDMAYVLRKKSTKIQGGRIINVNEVKPHIPLESSTS